jgi:hypothetical protein
LREFPTESLRRAAKLLDSRAGRSIVEIGGLALDPDDPRFELYGGSTVVWVEHTNATRIHSVDIDPTVKDRLLRVFPNEPRVRPVTMDGLEFLQRHEFDIDLLYLDAWDVPKNLMDATYQIRHMEAYLYARNNLHKDSLILIDDTDIREGGKGKLAVRMAMEEGWEVLWDGRQTMLARKESIAKSQKEKEE